jgi:hypothetical protein
VERENKKEKNVLLAVEFKLKKQRNVKSYGRTVEWERNDGRERMEYVAAPFSLIDSKQKIN